MQERAPLWQGVDRGVILTAPACSDQEFVELFEKLGGVGTANHLGIGTRNVMRRRANLEAKLRRQLVPPDQRATRTGIEHKNRVSINIDNGVLLVGSDGHYWPGAATTAHRAFVQFCKDLKPKAVIMNGDVLDGSTISRHPPINWEERPTLIDEIHVCQERLAEIERVLPRTVQMAWTLGNHDARLETRLASTCPEYAKIKGFHLKDHFGDRWKPAWSAWVNGNVVVKHRWKGGVHGVHNNTVGAGLTMVTGHDHSLRVSPYTDYTGTRWGVSTGCLADPDGPQFDYSEDNPRNHRSGFAVLTFHKGKLLTPELVSVFGPGSVDFRGSIVQV